MSRAGSDFLNHFGIISKILNDLDNGKGIHKSWNLSNDRGVFQTSPKVRFTEPSDDNLSRGLTFIKADDMKKDCIEKYRKYAHLRDSYSTGRILEMELDFDFPNETLQWLRNTVVLDISQKVTKIESWKKKYMDDASINDTIRADLIASFTACQEDGAKTLQYINEYFTIIHEIMFD